MTTTLKVLKARQGDAFILECNKDDTSFVIVIDSGPRLCSKDIVPIIKKLSRIDLLILTHYDEDHISGFIEYFKQYPDDALKIKEYWCNCANQMEIDNGTAISAYDNAKSFADCLRVILNGHQEVKWIELIKAGHTYKNDLVEIEVIAPSEEALKINREKYLETQYPAISSQSMKDDLCVPLEELAKRDTPKNTQVVNNASIAFIIWTKYKSYLMLGDVMADDVYEYLINKGFSEENTLMVDYVKVSHHGSKYNISNELLGIIKCDRFIISTNGGFGNAYHPDRETIAKILYHPKRDRNNTLHLYFNYTLEEISKKTTIFNVGEIEKSNCIVHENELEL